MFGPLGDWCIFVARVLLFRTRALSSSLLLMYVEEEGCVMSSRSWWYDLAAAIDGTFAPVVKSVLAETCAARLEAASIQGVLALTYARSWVLLHTLKATAFPAACRERCDVSLARCPVRAASACSGSSPCPRRHAGTRGSVCGGRSAETGPVEVDTIVGVGVSAAAGSESVKSRNSLRPGLDEREAPPLVG